MKRYVIILIASMLSMNNSLWVDRDPYSGNQSVQTGDIVKIIFDSQVKTEFSVEIQTDDNNTAKTNPDKKLVKELQPINSDYSFVKNNKGKYKTSGKISGTLSGIITGQDDNGNFTIEAVRETTYDNERQSLRLTGIVAGSSIKEKSVFTSDIAGLRVTFAGKINAKNITNPAINMKTSEKEDGTIVNKAELSEDEKQQLLLKYIRRVLGETE